MSEFYKHHDVSSSYHIPVKEAVEFGSQAENFLVSASVGNVSATLTADQILGGIVYSNPAGAINLTLPSATSLVAANPKYAVVGFGKHLYIRNDGLGAISLIAGAGVTIQGSSTVAVSAYAAHYYLRITSVTAGAEAYQLIRL